MEALGTALFLLLGLSIVFLLFIYLPASMAYRRGRNGFIWVCVSLLMSPIVAVLLLLVLGNAPKLRDEA
jgi:hypothetical protein